VLSTVVNFVNLVKFYELMHLVKISAFLRQRTCGSVTASVVSIYLCTRDSAVVLVLKVQW